MLAITEIMAEDKKTFLTEKTTPPEESSLFTEKTPLGDSSLTDVSSTYFTVGKEWIPEKFSSSQDLDPHTIKSPNVSDIPEKLPALGPKPPYLERYTSFLSECSPEQILENLFERLNEHDGCDFEYDPKKNRVSGFVYPSNSVCRFRARLYNGGDGRVLVEFQRRRGDAFAFSKFYKGVCEALQDIIERPYIFMEATVQFKGSTFSQETKVKEVDDSFLNIVFDMACSENSDTKRQAVELLANLSLDLGCTGKLCDFQFKEQVPKNFQRLVKEENSTTCVLLILLKKLLLSGNVSIARNAAFVLDKVTKHSMDIRRDVIDYMTDSILSVLYEPSTIELMDLQRKLESCVSTLKNCPKNGEFFKSKLM
jgi:hypothetical protein